MLGAHAHHDVALQWATAFLGLSGLNKIDSGSGRVALAISVPLPGPMTSAKRYWGRQNVLFLSPVTSRPSQKGRASRLEDVLSFPESSEKRGRST